MAMTLQQLLDLLPDNTKGEISAADMRVIVTELYNADGGLAAQVDSLTNQVTVLSGQVSDLSTTVAALDSTVQGYESRINYLETVVVPAAQTQATNTNLRLDALEQQDPTAVRSVAGQWALSKAVGSAPAVGQVVSDTGELQTATWLRFNDQDANGTDFGNVISVAVEIYAQEVDDSSNWVRWSVGSPITNLAGSYQVPVTRIAGDATGLSNKPKAGFVFTVQL
jgi:outer membrane murein-binding lipoprotein Lpp